MIVHILKMCTFYFGLVSYFFLFFRCVELRHFFHPKCLGGICNCNGYSFLYIQTLHNDCSRIEDVHHLFCDFFLFFISFLMGVELRHFSCLSVRLQHFKGAKFM